MKIIIVVCLLLCGCATKEVSTSIADVVRSEVVNLKEDLKKSTCSPEDKESFTRRLDALEANIKNIPLSCSIEKDGLKREISRLKLIVFSLIILIVGGGYMIIKKVKIL